MRYLAYTSKVYTVIMLAALVALGMAFSLAWKVLSPIPFTVLALLLGGAISACVMALASSKPVVVVDEDGLICHRRIRKIAWKDVVAVEHHPRARKLPSGGTQYSMSEAWRPVEVHVKNIDQYAGGFIAWGLRQHPSTKPAEAVGVLIECMGTTAKSQDLYDSIAYYIALDHRVSENRLAGVG